MGNHDGFSLNFSFKVSKKKQESYRRKILSKLVRKTHNYTPNHVRGTQIIKTGRRAFWQKPKTTSGFSPGRLWG